MSHNSEVSIYLADDHPIVVEGLKEIIHSKANLEVKGIAHDGEELISLLNSQLADVVVLDINMPKMNGIQCTKWIKEHFPTVKVLILTMYPERILGDELLKVGADGCLLKSRGSKDLLDAIDRVCMGKSYFDWISDFKSSHHSQTRVVFKLSDRENEIIRLIVRGKTSREIANILFISEETVKTHRKNIFKKLKIHHVTELMTFAMQQGII